MKILAFDSTAATASVCVYEDGRVLSLYTQDAGHTHSKTLLPMAKACLSNMGLSLSDIGLLAVSAGPGSFTGVRIAISIVKGLAFPQDLPCAAVSTLEAMAVAMPSSLSEILCCTMDARAGQVYNALFVWENGRLCRLCEDRAITLADLKNELISLKKSILLLGDGANLCYTYLREDSTLSVALPPAHLLYQSAYGVAVLAGEAPKTTADQLAPVYLRKPQAERQLLEALEKNGGIKL